MTLMGEILQNKQSKPLFDNSIQHLNLMVQILICSYITKNRTSELIK